MSIRQEHIAQNIASREHPARDRRQENTIQNTALREHPTYVFGNQEHSRCEDKSILQKHCKEYNFGKAFCNQEHRTCCIFYIDVAVKSIAKDTISREHSTLQTRAFCIQLTNKDNVIDKSISTRAYEMHIDHEIRVEDIQLLGANVAREILIDRIQGLGKLDSIEISQKILSIEKSFVLLILSTRKCFALLTLSIRKDFALSILSIRTCSALSSQLGNALSSQPNQKELC